MIYSRVLMLISLFYINTYLAKISPIILLKNCDKDTYRSRIFYSWIINTVIKDDAHAQCAGLESANVPLLTCFQSETLASTSWPFIVNSSATWTLLGELIHQYKHLSCSIQNSNVVVNIHKHWILVPSTILKASILQRKFGWLCKWCWQRQDSTSWTIVTTVGL